MLDFGSGGGSMSITELSRKTVMNRYSRYLNSLRVFPGGDGDLGTLMDGVIRKKLKIIPKNVT